MKKIFLFLKKNKDLVFIFIVSLFLSAPYLIDICSGYLNYNIFDLQSFLLWDYSLIKHLVPYKDTPYPYGILQYYKENNLLLLFVYYLVPSLNFTFIFYIFKKIIKSKYLLYGAFVLFYAFVLNITGFTVFARYGLFIAFSLLFSQLLTSQKNISSKLLFYIGIILGLLFFLVNDQGIYLFMSFIIVFFINDLIKEKNHNIFLSPTYLKLTVKKITFLILGFSVGILPLILFFLYHNSISQFIQYFKDLRDVVIVAKTPFFNFISTKDNLFTIFTLYISLFYLFTKIVFLKNKNSSSTLIQISLIVDILILEQKSIVRSISTQITFVAFILLILIFYEFAQLKIISNLTNKYKRIIYLLIFMIILFAFQLSGNYKNNFNIKNVNNNLGMLINNKCYENNLRVLLKKNNSYLNVYQYFKTQIKYNGKIFSFPPGDSIFYILFNQIPPYYNAIWNSSITNSQDEIKYINKNNIEFIFLNINASTAQDGVPDYIRMPLVYRYILNNFYPVYKIDNYLTLKKYNNMDFFSSKVLDNVPEFKKNLTNVYLYMIPYSEGLYKNKYFMKNQIYTTSFKGNYKTQNDLDISSKNKFIILRPSNNPGKNYLNFVKLKTNNGYESKIYFNACPINKICVINLSNLPYFYKERIIKNISVDDKYEGELLIYEINNSSNLW